MNAIIEFLKNLWGQMNFAAVGEFFNSMDLRGLNEASVVARYVLAAICGGIIGLEREHKHRPAGFRTHILVCIGAASTSLTGQYLLKLGTESGIPFTADPLRLSAQVIAGIGFIGAGTIIVTKRRQVKGLTTAAGLWTSAIVGIAIGIGYYEAAIFTALLIMLTELVLSKVDAFILSNSKNVNVYVEYDTDDTLAKIMNELKIRDVQIVDFEITKTSTESNAHISAIFALQLTKKMPQNRVLTALSKIDGVRDVEEL